MAATAAAAGFALAALAQVGAVVAVVRRPGPAAVAALAAVDATVLVARVVELADRWPGGTGVGLWDVVVLGAELVALAALGTALGTAARVLATTSTRPPWSARQDDSRSRRSAEDPRPRAAAGEGPA